MEEIKKPLVEDADAFVGLANEDEYKEKEVEKKPVEKKPRTWRIKALRISFFMLVIWAILLIVTSLAKLLKVWLS